MLNVVEHAQHDRIAESTMRCDAQACSKKSTYCYDAKYMSLLLFKCTDSALIVANTGRKFTIGGLEALCASHRSDKTVGTQRVLASSDEARSLVAEIQQRYLTEYKANKWRITEDARAEKETGRDYTNRLLGKLQR